MKKIVKDKNVIKLIGEDQYLDNDGYLVDSIIEADLFFGERDLGYLDEPELFEIVPVRVTYEICG